MCAVDGGAAQRHRRARAQQLHKGCEHRRRGARPGRQRAPGQVLRCPPLATKHHSYDRSLPYVAPRASGQRSICTTDTLCLRLEAFRRTTYMTEYVSFGMRLQEPIRAREVLGPAAAGGAGLQGFGRVRRAARGPQRQRVADGTAFGAGAQDASGAPPGRACTLRGLPSLEQAALEVAENFANHQRGADRGRSASARLSARASVTQCVRHSWLLRTTLTSGISVCSVGLLQPT